MSRGTARRTSPLSIRLTPEIKALAEAVARAENRSVTNLIETLVSGRAARLKIKVESAPSRESDRDKE
jgi:uncharacterized protein (DUF1778 family)